ncbi:MAG: helix-turn-helix domain-containing protein [Bacteroidota bacterium]|nr:helix-turn-helix domain-containing protein [Bacteroidota bacterium]
MESIVLLSIPQNELELLIERSVRNVIQERPLKVGNQKDDFSNKEYLSLSQASSFLNMSNASLYKLNSENRIKYAKRGKRVYYRREDLIAYVESGIILTREEQLKALTPKLIKRNSRS